MKTTVTYLRGAAMDPYRILADLVVVVHAAYVAFVVFGLAAILYGIVRKRAWARNFYFRWLHLLMIVVVVAESWLGITCPLTDLEEGLRTRAGETGYAGDFIGYWLHELLFYELPPWVFMAGYSLFGLLGVLTFVIAPPVRPRKHRGMVSTTTANATNANTTATNAAERDRGRPKD